MSYYQRIPRGGMMPNLSYSVRKYDLAMLKLHRDIHEGLVKMDNILGKIQTIPTSHGGTTRQVSEPEIYDTEMRLISLEITMDSRWIAQTDVENITVFIWEISQRFISQLKKYFFEVFSKTTEAVGNVFPAQGMNIHEAQIEMLKGLEMRFDKEGNHNYEFIVGEEMARKIRENPPTPEQMQKWEEAINAKREEYYAQKRTRRLS
jgi:hypothetical protein